MSAQEVFIFGARKILFPLTPQKRASERQHSQGRATRYHYPQTAAYASGRRLLHEVLSPRGGSYRQSVSSFVEHLPPLRCLVEISLI